MQFEILLEYQFTTSIEAICHISLGSPLCDRFGFLCWLAPRRTQSHACVYFMFSVARLAIQLRDDISHVLAVDGDCRWMEVITHVPCSSTGVLTINAEVTAIDGVSGVLGSAGPTSVFVSCPTISASGDMTFDIADVESLEDSGFLEDVILHEMGHVIGVGYVPRDDIDWLRLSG